MPRNPFGWDYPPGAENDPNAPWNQEDYEHCEHCDLTAYDEGEWKPQCRNCGWERGKGVCYLYLGECHYAYFFQVPGYWQHLYQLPNPIKDVIDKLFSLFNIINPINWPYHLGSYLSQFPSLLGKNDSKCDFPDEPECTCENCECAHTESERRLQRAYDRAEYLADRRKDGDY